MNSLKKALMRTLRPRAVHPLEQPVSKEGSTEGPAAAVDASDASAATAAPEEDVEVFSALELRDRVVIMLLFDQIVTEEQVAEVWRLWNQAYQGDVRTPLWRLLVFVPELDRELILAEAARVYSLEEAHLAPRALVPILRELVKHIPAPLWKKMIELRLIPLAEVEQASSHRKQLVFASHDPTHPEVIPLLQDLGVEAFELRYAPEHEIVEILAKAFPSKFKQLSKVLAEERKRFAETAPDGNADSVEAAPGVGAPAPALFAPAGVPPASSASLLPTSREAAPGSSGAPARPSAAASAAVPSKTSAPEWQPGTASVLNNFEMLLADAVRTQASGICLVANRQQKVEVYALVGQALCKWRIVDYVVPEHLFAAIKEVVLQSEAAPDDGHTNRIIERWIDAEAYRFHISVMPAGALLDREAVLVRRVEAER